MATTPLLFTSTEHAVEKLPEQGKNRGRKPSKTPTTQKKLPQRGMGVEKLERLRLQERWNEMTEEAATARQLDQSGAASYGTAPYPITHFGGPSESTVPMVLGAAASFGVQTVNGGGPGGFWGWDMGMMVQQRVGNGGGFSGLAGGRGSGQTLGLVDHSHLGSRVGASDLRVQFGSVFETSRELSSMPNLQQYVPEYRSDVYFKKKRLNVGNPRLNGGFNGILPVLPISGGQIFPGLHLQNNQYLNEGQIQINGFSQRQLRGPSAGTYSSSHIIPGFQLENNTQNFNRNQMNGLTSRGPRSSTAAPYYSCHINPYEGAGSQVLVEYDFFPRASSRSTSSKVEASVAEALRGEASDPSSTCVDLSLKL